MAFGFPADTLTELIAERARALPEHPAYTFLLDGEDDETIITRAELLEKSRALGRRLAGSFAPGERVLLLFPSGLDFVVAFFGCLQAGLIAVPVALPRFRGRSREHALDRLRGILADADPAVVLTTRGILDVIPPQTAREEFGERKLIAADEIDLSQGMGELPAVHGHTTCLLQYTSGSTGAPRGVRISHSNLLANGRMVHENFALPLGMVMVGWLPLHHDMGLIGMLLQPVFSDGHCVFMTPAGFMQHPIRWLRAVSRHRATISTAPNFAYDACVDRITAEEAAELDLSSWTHALNGAEPVRYDILLRFAERFESTGFRPGSIEPCYGMAEATLFVSGGGKQRAGLPSTRAPRSGPGSEAARPAVSCGKVHPDLELRIVDPDGGALPPDVVGEIWVRGPSIAGGYWRDAEAESFRGRTKNGEGDFLRTGDLGFIFQDELYITGRLKDLLIIDGRNLHPQDVEALATDAHPAIRSGGVAAFTVENARREKAILIAELERTFLDADQGELTRTLRGAMSAGMGLSLHDAVFVKPGSLPRTTSGKLMRRRAREMYLNGELGSVRTVVAVNAAGGADS